MTGRVRLSLSEIFDQGSAGFSASPAVNSDFPVTNLGTALRKRTTRTTDGSATVQNFYYDFTTAVDINFVHLYRHNMLDTTNITVELYNGTVLQESQSADATAAHFDDWDYSQVTLYFTQAYTTDRIEIEIDPGSDINPDGYRELCQVFAGEYIEPAINIDYGIELTWDQDVKQRRMQSGLIRTVPYSEMYRVVRGTFNGLTDDERDDYSELFRQVGLFKQVFVALYPEDDETQTTALERDTTFIGKFTEEPQFTKLNNDYWSMTVEISEG